MECKCWIFATDKSHKMIRIVPEWNVNYFQHLVLTYQSYIRIVPEWNVNNVAKKFPQLAGTIRIVPEWNVNLVAV